MRISPPADYYSPSHTIIDEFLYYTRKRNSKEFKAFFLLSKYLVNAKVVEKREHFLEMTL